MSLNLIISVILLGIALSADAFSVAVTDGLIYVDINKKRSIFIAAMFGIFQALMPLLGYWAVEGISVLVGSAAGEKAGQIMATIVTWVSFALLLFIGLKMLIESIKEVKKPDEEKTPKKFSYKEVLIMAVATAIDALASGVALHDENFIPSSISWQIFPSVTIIMCCTFVISLIGVFLGKQIVKLFKGKPEISGIIGGIILVLLGTWVVLSHYIGL